MTETIAETPAPASDQNELVENDQKEALESLMTYLEDDCPEMALFGVFINKFECDESSNNVRIWFKNGNYYEGAFSGGTMDGMGKYHWHSGLAYQGTFEKNTIEGFGTYAWPDGTAFEGEVKDGLSHGNGLMRLPNDQSYNGQWANGRKDGLGTMTYDPSGLETYSGEWANERRHGFGFYQYNQPISASYAGYWTNGCRHGVGSAAWPDQREIYSGYWDRGIQQGIGRHVWAAERATPAQYQIQNSYVGEFSSGMRHGKGTFNYAGGASYYGDWVDNVKYGSGKVIFKNGESYDGQFAHDRLFDGPGYIDIARTPDPRLFERQLHKKVANSETLSDLLNSSIPMVLNSPHLKVERSDETEYGPSDNHTEPDLIATRNCSTVLLRFASELRRIFSFYCDLGSSGEEYTSEGPRPTYQTRSLTRFLWWRLIKDSRMPFTNTRIESPAELDRILAKIFLKLDNDNPYDVGFSILFGDFLLWLLATALIYEGYGRPAYLHNDESLPPASTCLEQFLTEFILPNCCIVHGRLFSSQENAAITMKSLPLLVKMYGKLADMRESSTLSGRQLVATLAGASIAAATPTVRALAGNVFLSAESDCTPYVFAELTVLEMGEALAEVAEFLNEGLGAGDAPAELSELENTQTGTEKSPTALGSVIQDRQTGGDYTSLFKSGTVDRIDWSNIVQHLLSLPNLADLPRQVISLKQTTLVTPAGFGRGLSGYSLSRSASPANRQATDVGNESG